MFLLASRTYGWRIICRICLRLWCCCCCYEKKENLYEKNGKQCKCTNTRAGMIFPIKQKLILISRSIDEITFHREEYYPCNTMIRLTTCYTNTLEKHIVFRVLLNYNTTTYTIAPINSPMNNFYNLIENHVILDIERVLLIETIKLY